MRPTHPHAAPPLRYRHTVNTPNTLNTSADHTEVVPPAMHHTRGRDELRLVRTTVNTGHLLKKIPPRTTQRWSLPNASHSREGRAPPRPHCQHTVNTPPKKNPSADHTEVVPPTMHTSREGRAPSRPHCRHTVNTHKTHSIPPRTTRRWSLPSTTPTATPPRTVLECRVNPTYRSLKLESPQLV